MFDGDTYEQCAFTPDDPNNSWCYTESECAGSSSSDTYAGDSWAFCNIRENKRLAFGGAVKHSAAASSSSAEASSTELDSGAAGGVATAAAGVVAALLVVGAIVVVAVHRSRSRQTEGAAAPAAAPTIDTVENGIPTPDETYGAADALERADSYCNALASSTTINSGAADFEAAAFVLDAAAGGSLKVKSVRRPNPAYRSSAYIEDADTEGI